MNPCAWNTSWTGIEIPCTPGKNFKFIDEMNSFLNKKKKKNQKEHIFQCQSQESVKAKNHYQFNCRTEL